jgi:hypothetical protein
LFDDFVAVFVMFSVDEEADKLFSDFSCEHLE